MRAKVSILAWAELLRATKRKIGPIKRLYIRASDLIVAWGRARAERKRERAASSIMKWVERRPEPLRLNTAIHFSASCSDYPVAKRLAEWVLERPESSADMVLFYLGRMGVHRLSADGWTEEKLRSDPAWFGLVDGLVSGLRSGRYVWRGSFRSDSRDPVIVPVEAWRDVPSLQYCDLYADIETEYLPDRILKAFEKLGAYSGRRVSKMARNVLAKRRRDGS